MSGRPPIPQAKRDAAAMMRRAGATQDQIALALGVSAGWVHKFCTDLAAANPIPAPVLPVAASVEPEPEDAPPDDAAGAQPGASGVASDIARLVAELEQLRKLTASGTLDGAGRIRASAQIGQLTSRLAALRKEQRVILAPERDANVLRAGHAAADKLRRLLEEAIGEELSKAPGDSE